MESPFKADALKGKVALITGGGTGIGFEISTQFGKHGASIAIMGRRKQVLDSAVSALQSLGIPVLFQALEFCICLSESLCFSIYGFHFEESRVDVIVPFWVCPFLMLLVKGTIFITS